MSDLTLEDQARKVQLAARVLLAAAGAIVVGSFLPWMVVRTGFGSVSRSGMEGGGDGIVTVIAGGLLGFIGMTILSGRPPGRAWVGVLLLSSLTFIVAAIDIADVSNRAESVESEFATASVGSGLYLVALGAVMGFAMCIVLLSATGPKPGPPDAAP